jgi:hypothetical protein
VLPGSRKTPRARGFAFGEIPAFCGGSAHSGPIPSPLNLSRCASISPAKCRNCGPGASSASARHFRDRSVAIAVGRAHRRRQQLLGEPCGTTVALPVEPVVAVHLCTAIHTIRVTSRAATIEPALVRTSVCTSTRSARPRADPEMKKPRRSGVFFRRARRDSNSRPSVP